MDLNDDCLFLILNRLNLKDQISAAQTCRRFHNLLSFIWQRTYLEFHVNFPNRFFPTMYKRYTCKELDILMESICETAQKLVLGELSYDQWKIIKLYKYPQVKYLSLDGPNFITDDIVLEMTEVFPNLRTFSPRSYFITGQHITKWQNLECLDLSFCDPVKFSRFEELLEELQLKSVTLCHFDSYTWTSTLAHKKFCELEEIFVRCDAQLEWLADITLFPNLKRIVYSDCLNGQLILHAVRDVAQHESNDVIN